MEKSVMGRSQAKLSATENYQLVASAEGCRNYRLIIAPRYDAVLSRRTTAFAEMEFCDGCAPVEKRFPVPGGQARAPFGELRAGAADRSGYPRRGVPCQRDAGAIRLVSPGRGRADRRPRPQWPARPLAHRGDAARPVRLDAPPAADGLRRLFRPTAACRRGRGDAPDADHLACATWHLFDAIARATDHRSLHHAVEQANDRLAPVRWIGLGLVDDAADELSALIRDWQQGDEQALRSGLDAYHERRVQLVPHIVALLGEGSDLQH